MNDKISVFMKTEFIYCFMNFFINELEFLRIWVGKSLTLNFVIKKKQNHLFFDNVQIPILFATFYYESIFHLYCIESTSTHFWITLQPYFCLAISSKLGLNNLNNGDLCSELPVFFINCPLLITIFYFIPISKIFCKM